MTASELATLAAGVIVASVVAVEALARMPLLRVFENVARPALQAIAVVTDPAMPERQKERRLKRCALLLFAAGLQMSLLLLGWFALIAASWVAIERLSGVEWKASLDRLSNVGAQVGLVLVAVTYAAARSSIVERKKAKEHQSSSNYDPAERMLHRLAFEEGSFAPEKGCEPTRHTLFVGKNGAKSGVDRPRPAWGGRRSGHVAPGTSSVQRLAERWDIRRARRVKAPANSSAPIYVTGLARGGTTILLRLLHQSGRLASLTYRSMPFVLAPLTWPNLSRRLEGTAKARQRAHGDGIFVDFDSPEEFEEVFWLNHLPNYVLADRLLPVHRSSGDVINAYRDFVHRVVLSAQRHGTGLGGTKTETKVSPRYLAKNNNNLLRLPVLREAFPDARIIIAFRHPLAHAASLLAQHRHFTRLQEEDPFILAYMRWLGHFEFGGDLRPFAVDGFSPSEDGEARPSEEQRDPMRIEYWIHYWTKVYEFVLSQHDQQLILVDHEKLRAEPERVLQTLEPEVGLEAGALVASAGSVRPASEQSSQPLPEATQRVYDRLRERAL